IWGPEVQLSGTAWPLTRILWLLPPISITRTFTGASSGKTCRPMSGGLLRLPGPAWTGPSPLAPFRRWEGVGTEGVVFGGLAINSSLPLVTAYYPAFARAAPFEPITAIKPFQELTNDLAPCS